LTAVQESPSILVLCANSHLNLLQAEIKTTIMTSLTQNALRLAAGILLASVTSILAQTTATTDPVGFITLNVPGDGGSGAGAVSFKGLSLTKPVEYQGSAETVGTNTLVDNEATWTDNQFNGANGAYFVEIASGANAGSTYDIQSTTAGTKTITLAQNLGAGITAPVTFKVRKHWTIASVFGANNEAGLTGGSAVTADQIFVYNGTSYDSYYYQSIGLGGVGWRKSGAPSVDVSSTVLFMEDGIAIRRQQAAATNIVLLGSVKMGQTLIPVASGVNVLSNVYAAGMTLASSGLYTGNPSTGIAGGSAVSADQVFIWNGTSYDTYYYQTAGLGGVGWRKGGAPSVDVSSTSIPTGTSILIRRQDVSGFSWVIPQHPASI
jgi:uncharacterized protein (TIGR02597 family)